MSDCPYLAHHQLFVNLDVHLPEEESVPIQVPENPYQHLNTWVMGVLLCSRNASLSEKIRTAKQARLKDGVPITAEVTLKHINFLKRDMGCSRHNRIDRQCGDAQPRKEVTRQQQTPTNKFRPPRITVSRNAFKSKQLQSSRSRSRPRMTPRVMIPPKGR
jgi:hypothetical protein